ncbi:MAG: N-acetylmuramoyl-L-alanine amidase family protein [Chloroflexota bacterium]
MEAPPIPPARVPTRGSLRPARVFASTLGLAVLLATLFNLWTPVDGLFTNSLSDKLALILTAQPENDFALTPQPQLRIGIVAGHAGNDSGAVCYDDEGNPTLTEAEVNLDIASRVQKALSAEGYQVDLLNEFDTRLNGYRAVALVSIHNDSCDYINDQATGFKVAAALNTHDFNRATRLTECLRDRYQAATGLTFHAGSITGDMREYHAFSEINPNTIAAIIETGFLNLDQELLVEEPDKVADGVVRGILCFVRNENVEPTPSPTFAP